MPSPFYDAIKGTTSGTPGTGAFTPNAAATGYRAWSNVPTGWVGVVLFEDAGAKEAHWSYWNGTTLSRGTNQLAWSTTGSVLSLTSSATASLVNSGAEIQSHLATTPWFITITNRIAAGQQGFGGAATVTGTSALGTIATTNYLTEQVRNQLTSVTTANGQAGWSYSVASALTSSSAGHGGWEFLSRWGPSGLPTGPRLFAGMTSSTFVASTAEPSALTAHVAAFAKDSTDTNIQLLVNSNAGSGTKTDTGIPLVANGWYETSIWTEPGSTTVYGLLIRLDTGDIWFGSTTTDVPANGAITMPQVLGGLNGTNTGTAFVMNMQSLMVRTGV